MLAPVHAWQTVSLNLGDVDPTLRFNRDIYHPLFAPCSPSGSQLSSLVHLFWPSSRPLIRHGASRFRVLFRTNIIIGVAPDEKGPLRGRQVVTDQCLRRDVMWAIWRSFRNTLNSFEVMKNVAERQWQDASQHRIAGDGRENGIYVHVGAHLSHRNPGITYIVELPLSGGVRRPVSCHPDGRPHPAWFVGRERKGQTGDRTRDYPITCGTLCH